MYGQNGINVCVLSRDSDFMQLMDNRSVHLLYVKSGKKDVVGPIKFDVTATGGQRLSAWDGGGLLCTEGGSLLRSQGMLSKGIQREHGPPPAFGMPPVNHGYKDASHILHISNPGVPALEDQQVTDKHQQDLYASSFQAFHLFAYHALLHNWLEGDLLQVLGSFVDVSPRIRVSYWVNKMLHNLDVAQPQLSCYPLGERNRLVGSVGNVLRRVKNAGVAPGLVGGGQGRGQQGQGRGQSGRGQPGRGKPGQGRGQPGRGQPGRGQ